MAVVLLRLTHWLPCLILQQTHLFAWKSAGYNRNTLSSSVEKAPLYGRLNGVFAVVYGYTCERPGSI